VITSGIAVEAACIFWEENNLNHYADAGEVKALNGLVNRGSAKKTPLHWDKREALYNELGHILPKNLSFEEAENGDGEYTPAPEPVAPVVPAEEVKPIDLDKAQSGIDKCQATLQSPAIKTVAKRASVRLGGGLVTVWSTTGGKVAIILTAVVILGVAGGLIYSYRKQIQLGYQIAKATVKKAVGGLF
jgi:hypothetical protein